jgi:hypothetical protein
MATTVCLAVIADSPARLIVGTYEATTGLLSLLFGSGQPKRDAGMIEAWDFDADLGVLRVVPAPGSTAQERQIPLSCLVNLSWGFRLSGTGSRDDMDDSHFEVRLFFDDGGRPSFLNLPGSADFLCAWSGQARTMQSRLRAFLKPLCPRLEGTTLETLVSFWRNPAAGLKSIQDMAETRLAALDNLVRPPEPSGLAHPELAATPDPAAPARELLTRLQSALGHLSQVAAEQQKKRIESRGQRGE